MSLAEVLRRYDEVIVSDAFVAFAKEFARRMSSALSRAYAMKNREPSLVQVIHDAVNCLDSLTKDDGNRRFEISTRSVFIHGRKSMVEFDYYGLRVIRELGDIIFIVSIIFSNRTYFQKLTISQFKKDTVGRSGIHWRIDNREQLYLLSRFPTFRGAGTSIVPSMDQNLPNFSGCLGSYGLLYSPGDFAFLSATELARYLANTVVLSMDDLDYFAWRDRIGSDLPGRHQLFLSYKYASDVYDFSEKYLKGELGEYVFTEAGVANYQLRSLLRSVFAALQTSAVKTRDSRLLDFLDGFRKFPYPDNEGPPKGEGYEFHGGGIGIVHTTVNLGE